jgi:trigger factor
MQVTETLSDGLRRAFSVVVPAAEIEGKVATKLAEIGRTIKLPGFRPGKVPVNLVRQRYGASVMAEVMQDALNTATDQVVEERGLRPAGQPKVALDGEPKIDGRAAADLAFRVEMELLPEIATPDLAALSLTRLRAEVAADTIDKTLERLATQQRELVAIEDDRGAETGDVLTVDFNGTVDGVPFEGGAGQDAKVEIGGAGFIPGFSEGMAGMKPGETRSVDVTFPAEYHAEALKGKAAVFEVTAKALGRPAELAIDDAFAAKLGFESLDKLREMVTAQMQRELDQMSRLHIKRELLDVLAAQADFPAPQNLVEAEFGAIWARVEQDLSTGQIDDEDRGKEPAVLRAEYRAIADRRVRLGLLLSEIGRNAGVQVSQAELTQALRTEAARYPGQEMQVVEFFRKTPQAIEQLRGPLFEDKVVDYILEMARVEDRLVSPEELSQPPTGETAAPKIAFAPAAEPEAAPEREPGPDAELRDADAEGDGDAPEMRVAGAEAGDGSAEPG